MISQRDRELVAIWQAKHIPLWSDSTVQRALDLIGRLIDELDQMHRNIGDIDDALAGCTCGAHTRYTTAVTT